MKQQKNFFERVAGKSPIAPDLFWGTLAMMIYMVAETLSEFTHWPGWFILATGALCILFVMEALRFRVPLLQEYKAARRVSLVIISCMIVICIASFLRRLW